MLRVGKFLRMAKAGCKVVVCILEARMGDRDVGGIERMLPKASAGWSFDL